MNRIWTGLAGVFFALLVVAESRILVLEEAPETYTKVSDVGATSRQSSARTPSGKRSYVIREMQRQAAALGANAIVIENMRELKQVKPIYGRRGGMEYEKIIHMQGSGIAIIVSEDLIPKEEPDGS